MSWNIVCEYTFKLIIIFFHKKKPVGEFFNNGNNFYSTSGINNIDFVPNICEVLNWVIFFSPKLYKPLGLY